MEQLSDTAVVVDTFIVVGGTEADSPTALGPTTFALREAGRHPIDAATQRRVRQWCEDDTILDVELLHDGPMLSVAVRDGSSRLHFDIATRR